MERSGSGGIRSCGRDGLWGRIGMYLSLTGHDFRPDLRRPFINRPVMSQFDRGELGTGSDEGEFEVMPRRHTQGQGATKQQAVQLGTWIFEQRQLSASRIFNPAFRADRQGGIGRINAFSLDDRTRPQLLERIGTAGKQHE